MNYSRQELTQRFVARLLSTSTPLTSLFLAAHRRTGKSTFIREDLRQALEANGALVIYADLWNNKAVDPSAVIASAIFEKIEEQKPKTKWFSEIESIDLSIAGVGVSAQKGKKTLDLSFSEALSELSDKTKKKIVLMVDEFQHALTTAGGENALFSLKAARDELNSSKHHGMIILGTGSNQDKLASMRNSKEQAFYLTHLTTLAYLDKNFTNWLVKQSGLDLDPDVVWSLFEKSGHKPEIVNGAIADLQLSAPTEGSVTRVFQKMVEYVLEKDAEEQTKKINALPVTQWAVLGFMASDDKKTGLQTKESFEACQNLARQRGETVRFDASVVQGALLGLQKKKFLWSEARGTYHIEDEQIVSIMKNLIKNLPIKSSTQPNP